MTSPALPPLPDCDIPSWRIEGAEDFCDYFKEATLRAYGQQCRDEARAQVANELIAEITLEGFGCACEPNVQCCTCKERSVLAKALGSFIHALKTTPPQGEPR